MNASSIRRIGTPSLVALLIVFFVAGCAVPGTTLVNPQQPAVAPAQQNTIVGSKTVAKATDSTTAANNAASSTAAQPTPAAASIDLTAFASAIRNVAQEVKPAVVQITNQQTQFDQYSQAFTVPAGVGSGVIYDSQGHILTNNHVVAGADSLLVSLPDGRSFPAKVVGADPQTDLAVIQIDGANLPIAKLGDSSQLQVGDWVVAIGNALALPGGPTVTEGVVSALDRSVQEPSDTGGQGPFLFNAIQTSAPINPGNSGGALVNLAGEVVGINTLVAGQAEPGVQAEGIGFAISIATAKPIADELVATGHVVHAYLGINYVPLNPAIAVQLGTTARNGDVLASVVSGSPAAQAGLQRRDIITAIDGKTIVDESALALAISTHKPGDTLTLTVLRGSQQQTVKVTLTELPVSEVGTAVI